MNHQFSSTLQQHHRSLWQTKEEQALAGGGSAKKEHQRRQGKHTARERIALLTDYKSFQEVDQLRTSIMPENSAYTDGVITGFATINGRNVALYAQDFTVHGGSLGQQHAAKICKIMDMAVKVGCPLIGLIDSGGARIQEGIHALAGYGEIFMRNTRYSGIIPQISVILGPCAGGAVYSPALTDFILTTQNISNLFITGPNVIQQALHQTISKEDLGGAHIHATKSGVAHFVGLSEEHTFDQLKQLLSYLPQNFRDTETFDLAAPTSWHHLSSSQQPNLATLVPADSNKAYDMKQVIEYLVDPGTFFEVQEQYAPNIIIGFARMENRVVGLVANQPSHKAGTLDIDASSKAARFIRTCDIFDIPLISLVDIPGFLPGIEQEHNGIIRHGAKLLYAYAEATVPKITVILRKAYGGAYIVMGSKHLGADFNFAWPQAEIAVLGARSAIQIIHGKQLREMPHGKEREEQEEKYIDEYTEQFLHPFTAAARGYIDAIISPDQTRTEIIRALKITRHKVESLPKKKHGNIPL